MAAISSQPVLDIFVLVEPLWWAHIPQVSKYPSKQQPWAQLLPEQAAIVSSHNWISIWLGTKHLLSSNSGWVKGLTEIYCELYISAVKYVCMAIIVHQTIHIEVIYDRCQY